MTLATVLTTILENCSAATYGGPTVFKDREHVTAVGNGIGVRIDNLAMPIHDTVVWHITVTSHGMAIVIRVTAMKEGTSRLGFRIQN